MFKIAVCDDDVSSIELEKRIIQKVFETNQADVEIDEYYSGEALLALTKEQMEKKLVVSKGERGSSLHWEL